LLQTENGGWLVGRKWSHEDYKKQSYFVLQTIDGGKHWIDHSPKLLVPIPRSETTLRGDSMFGGAEWDRTADLCIAN